MADKRKAAPEVNGRELGLIDPNKVYTDKDAHDLLSLTAHMATQFEEFFPYLPYILEMRELLEERQPWVIPSTLSHPSPGSGEGAIIEERPAFLRKIMD